MRMPGQTSQCLDRRNRAFQGLVLMYQQLPRGSMKHSVNKLLTIIGRHHGETWHRLLMDR